MTKCTRTALLVGTVMVGAAGQGPGVGTAAGAAQVPAASPAPAAAATPVTDWYFYKVKWGHDEEFLDLFQKYQYQVLKAQVGGGLVSFKVYTPTYHGDGRADWSVAVAMTYRDAAARINPPAADIARRLFPDQATYRKDERRRWELLEAHWDMPLYEVNFETRQFR